MSNSKGRAKKRLTYTRRFVNVVLTGGKRKVSSTLPPPKLLNRETDTLQLDEPQPRRRINVSQSASDEPFFPSGRRPPMT